MGLVELWEKAGCPFLFGIWEKQFREQKNPLYAWDAIRHCIENQIPFPEWVLNYLSKTSGKLTSKAYGITGAGNDKRAESFVYEALGLNRGKGPDDCFGDFQRAANEAELLLEINNEWQESGRKNIVNILESIGKKHHVSYEVARAIWYKNKKSIK